MNRPGSAQVLGPALLASGAVMIVLAVLLWTGVFSMAPDGRTIVGLALLLAGIVDVFVGLRFLQRVK